MGEIHGVTVINCGLKTSMFNLTHGSPKSFKISDAIHEIKQRLAGQLFAWWISQSEYTPTITQTLLEAGFIIETVEHAMICDLSNVSRFVQKTGLAIKHVTNISLLQDFISVLEPYDTHLQEFYRKMRDGLFGLDEKLVVGYAGGKPVTIGILFLSGNSAGIFRLITKKKACGKGYATAWARTPLPAPEWPMIKIRFILFMMVPLK